MIGPPLPPEKRIDLIDSFSPTRGSFPLFGSNPIGTHADLGGSWQESVVEEMDKMSVRSEERQEEWNILSRGTSS